MSDAELEATATALVGHRAAFEAFTRGATEIILRRVPATPGITVLDLGSGIGDPALAIAEQLRETGRVTASDRVAPFLRHIAEEARSRKLENLDVVATAMETLPFESESFDCVVSRLGFQFSSDVAGTLKETRRVLRKDGRVVFVVWGSPEQPLMATTVTNLLEAAGAPPFRAGEPGPFRFSVHGSLTRVLVDAGFDGVVEGVRGEEWVWPGTSETLWAATRDTSRSLFDAVLGRLSTEERRALETRTVERLRAYERDGKVVIPVEVRWAEGRKS